MRWYIAGLAIAFGVDYMEFAPLPGGGLGGSGQSKIMKSKTFSKSPGVLMRMLSEGLGNYGAFPRGITMRFNDKDYQEELERQEMRTKAAEEGAIWARSGILPPDNIRKDLVRRGIFDPETIAGIAGDYGLDILIKKNNPVGQIGGNTLAEDAARNNTGKIDNTTGGQLRKDMKTWVTELFKSQKPEVRDIVVNVPKQEQSIIHVNQPAPIVNVSVPEQLQKDQPAPIVNVNVPVPSVHVAAPTVNLSTPKIKREVQKVNRKGNNIDSTETTVEYED
jgi:hypothetical protein